MSVIDRLASSLGRRDTRPNQDLAKELARTGNKVDIKELAEGLHHKDKAIRTDCLKVLYEIGYIQPELISPYVIDFLDLLKSRNNRLVWGAMIALSTIAGLKPDVLFRNMGLVIKAMENGSVITVDNAVTVLAAVSSADPTYEKSILPRLLRHLKMCRPKELPQHAERAFVAIHKHNKEHFKEVLVNRLDELTKTQKSRVNRLLKKMDQL